MGIAIRTGSPLSLNLAEPTWKQLAGMPLTLADLTEVRKKLFIHSIDALLTRILNNRVFPSNEALVCRSR